MKKIASFFHLFTIRGVYIVFAFFFAAYSVYMTSPAAYAVPATVTHTYLNGTWAYDPVCDVTGGGTTEASASGPTIVIDPGHSGTDINTVDPATGLNDHDYPNPNENEEVFYVSLLAKKQLVADGYKVILTKGDTISTDVNSVTSAPVEQGAKLNASLRERADVANTANAALAVSVHDDHGESWSNFAQIYVPSNGLSRTGTKGEVKYGDSKTDVGKIQLANDVAATSQRYGGLFASARTAAEGHTAAVTAIDFGGRAGIDPGHIPMVELFSQVPWVYNEVGAAPKNTFLSDSQLKKYAQGIINGVEASVPYSKKTATATQAGNITSASSIVMQKVDLSSFNPDPKATAYFNDTSLKLMKKYIPLYVQAAQLEGVPQNWEIIAGLHGPETSYGNSFEPNGGGYSGPFQEDPRQLNAYLSDPDYGPVLKTLVKPDGTPIIVKNLSDSQFVVLARLAYKHWFSDALGTDYAKLKTGPIPFSSDTSSSTMMHKIIKTWNGDGPVGMAEGFNGYDAKAWPYTTSPSEWPGMATTYYLLKQWEAAGGMSTVAGTAATNTGPCASATATSTGSTDCTAATGDTKILCEAHKYGGIYYKWGGGHQGYDAYKKDCPDPSNPPNNQATGAPAANHNENPSPCGVDCSSLVSLAVDDAFGQKFMWTVSESDGTMSQPQYWQSVPESQAQPGDIATILGHVEIVDHYDSGSGKLYTFGAHSGGTQTGLINTTNYFKWFWHYTGPGAGAGTPT